MGAQARAASAREELAGMAARAGGAGGLVYYSKKKSPENGLASWFSGQGKTGLVLPGSLLVLFCDFQ